MPAYKSTKVIENRQIASDIYFMKLDRPLGSKPGQFFMLRSEDFRGKPLLSRPFGVCDEDKESISLLYQVKGEGTGLMKTFKKGKEVKVLGPLGRGFTLKEDKKIAIVGGGIGLAPLFFLAKKLKTQVDLYLGFSDYEYFSDYFKPYVNKVLVTIDKIDKKFITDAINPDDYDYIYACGPNPMLYSLSKKTKKARVEVSMEAHMACGIGACLGCTIRNAKGDFVRVCKDGPVFDSREVFG
ncbi:MAG: dihydroorotate dehydrogenase electron transfer subunit [Anaerococcus sp.]|nr:dihydroorotate dehydrogenase electron transfer subunit [Anaerococcus sp.]